MYSCDISKVVDRKLSEKEIEKRVSKIALELDMGAFGLTHCRIAWEANKKIEWHDAIRIQWSQREPFSDMRVLAYALNKAFKGAQSCINSPSIGQYFTGHTKPDEEDEFGEI